MCEVKEVLVRSTFAMGIALVSVTPAFAQTASPQPASTQQRFDAAKTLIEQKKFAEALSAFNTLESELLKSSSPKPTNLAVVRVFKAEALSRLERWQESKALLTLALEGGALERPAMSETRQLAQSSLASILARELDDAGAGEIYEALAASVTDPKQKMLYLVRQAQMLTLLEPGRAIALADEALAIARSDPKIEKSFLAAVHNAKGRALLNAGKVEEARASFRTAISLRGGLDHTIDYSEFSMRSDAAIAALRAKDREGARKLLAYTGAGRTLVRFPTGTDMTLPQCGGIDDLKPEDTAVVEFIIGRDGKVRAARPVFASRTGQTGYAFARAVNGWTWNPASIAGLTDFYLSTARVEVRCSNSFQRPSLMSESQKAASDWFASQGVTSNWIGQTEKDARGRLTSQSLANNKAAMADTHLFLAANATGGAVKRQKHYAAALSLMRAAGAPVSAWLAPAIRSTFAAGDQSGSPLAMRAMAAELEPLRNDPAIRSDRNASATVGMVLAELYAAARLPAQEMAVLKSVADDPELEKNSPLRVAALLAFANASVAAGDVAGAAGAYARTGLSARQCAALDSPPALIKSNASSSDFPMEALMWGFEGWSRQEYDIAANGKTENIRTVISFPPSVFSGAAEALAKSFQYRPSFRPDGGPGCGGQSGTIQFNLPKGATPPPADPKKS
jgi:tetratricopeptide (TPR) repeat protein